jgi:hypothetical protein
MDYAHGTHQAYITISEFDVRPRAEADEHINGSVKDAAFSAQGVCSDWGLAPGSSSLAATRTIGADKNPPPSPACRHRAHSPGRCRVIAFDFGRGGGSPDKISQWTTKPAGADAVPPPPRSRQLHQALGTRLQVPNHLTHSLHLGRAPAVRRLGLPQPAPAHRTCIGPGPFRQFGAIEAN